MQICLNWKHKELWLFFMSFISDSAIFQKRKKKRKRMWRSYQLRKKFHFLWLDIYRTNFIQVCAQILPHLLSEIENIFFLTCCEDENWETGAKMCFFSVVLEILLICKQRHFDAAHNHHYFLFLASYIISFYFRLVSIFYIISFYCRFIISVLFLS